MHLTIRLFYNIKKEVIKTLWKSNSTKMHQLKYITYNYMEYIKKNTLCLGKHKVFLLKYIKIYPLFIRQDRPVFLTSYHFSG